MEQLISFDYAMSCIVSSVAEDGSGDVRGIIVGMDAFLALTTADILKKPCWTTAEGNRVPQQNPTISPLYSRIFTILFMVFMLHEKLHL